MSRPPAGTTERDGAGSLSRRQTPFMVAALVASVNSFQLNATMLTPAIRGINTELGTRRVRSDVHLTSISPELSRTWCSSAGAISSAASAS